MMTVTSKQCYCYFQQTQSAHFSVTIEQNLIQKLDSPNDDDKPLMMTNHHNQFCQYTILNIMACDVSYLKMFLWRMSKLSYETCKDLLFVIPACPGPFMIMMTCPWLVLDLSSWLSAQLLTCRPILKDIPWTHDFCDIILWKRMYHDIFLWNGYLRIISLKKSTSQHSYTVTYPGIRHLVSLWYQRFTMITYVQYGIIVKW